MLRGLAVLTVALGVLAACSADPAPATTAPSASSSVYEGTGTTSDVRVDVDLDYGKAEIGLLPRDTIRPIYSPQFASSQTGGLAPGDFVIGLALDGEAKAYPIAILWTREMVNDAVGGIPVLVSW